MNTTEFLQEVVTAQSGQLLLAVRNHTLPWSEQFYQWPEQADLIQARIDVLKSSCDMYFSSHLFAEPVSSKDNVLPCRTVQADLDAAHEYPLEPSILVQTSPNRYQGYWLLKYDMATEQLEALSKKLTYATPESDHSGWSLGHRVRLPGTLNFKYNNGPHQVEVIRAPLTKYAPEDFDFLPNITAQSLAIHESDFVTNADSISFPIGPLELITSVKDRIPQGVYYDYVSKIASEDRSAALWALMCSLFESGLTREQVFWLSKHSPNNKFSADLRYHANQELAKDVERAEQHVKIRPVDLVSVIDKVRNMSIPSYPGGALFKKRQIYNTVKFAMEATGKFIKVIAGLAYYIPAETGRPIPLTPGSERFRALLHLKYGINSADQEYTYVHNGLLDVGVAIEKEVQEATLSFYEPPGTLYFHTGKREVLKITSDRIIKVMNGECGVLFPWHDMYEPFDVDIGDTYQGDWGDAVFGDLHNTTNMIPKQAKALLKSWLIFSLLRSEISTRPILAFFGPPGSSKSTIPHRIYSLIYARRLAVSGITGPDDFDNASTRLPVLCIDNLDTYVSWIMDKLAQAIGNADIVTRKLFTDVEMIRKRRQAMLIVTAHNPKFTREDVTSRLLLITLDEVAANILKNETHMHQHILDNRARLWSSILHDVMTVFNTPMPTDSTIKWRIADFTLYGEWIATALGYQDDFNAGVGALLGTQQDTLLQQDDMLAGALTGLEIKEPVSATQLWNILLVRVGGNQGAFIHTYKDPIRLQQKLVVMRPALSKIVEITAVVDPVTRSRKWMVHPRETSSTPPT